MPKMIDPIRHCGRGGMFLHMNSSVGTKKSTVFNVLLVALCYQTNSINLTSFNRSFILSRVQKVISVHKPWNPPRAVLKAPIQSSPGHPEGAGRKPTAHVLVEHFGRVRLACHVREHVMLGSMQKAFRTVKIQMAPHLTLYVQIARLSQHMLHTLRSQVMRWLTLIGQVYVHSNVIKGFKYQR